MGSSLPRLSADIPDNGPFCHPGVDQPSKIKRPSSWNLSGLSLPQQLVRTCTETGNGSCGHERHFSGLRQMLFRKCPPLTKQQQSQLRSLCFLRRGFKLLVVIATSRDTEKRYWEDLIITCLGFWGLGAYLCSLPCACKAQLCSDSV